MLIYEMVAGRPPFYDEDRVRMFKNICSVKFTCPPTFSKARLAPVWPHASCRHMLQALQSGHAWAAVHSQAISHLAASGMQPAAVSPHGLHASQAGAEGPMQAAADESCMLVGHLPVML